MMLALLVLAEALVSAPPGLGEIERAITAGRFEQAKIMLATAMADGAKGEAVERLLADLAFAAGAHTEALARYTALLNGRLDGAEILERAAISALKINDPPQAKRLAERAINFENASWRAWNARGIIADLEGDFGTADLAYQRALALAPTQAEILNNVGWSRLLRGDWEGAIAPLEQACSLMPKSVRAANNLELALAAIDNDLPKRRKEESEEAWAARLNDAGVAARLRGQRARAVAAFARAIEARGAWYDRASGNLDSTSAGE